MSEHEEKVIRLMVQESGKLLSEIERLQAENDKLKHELELEKFRGAGEIEAYRRETSVAVKKAAQVKAENAKLHAELTDLRLNSCPSCGIKVENERLRECLRKVWDVARLLQANGQIEGLRITDEFRAECEADFAELGIEVDE